MAANETALPVGKQNILINNKFLGIAAMIGAPMLLAEMLFRFYSPETAETHVRVNAFLEFLYICGWICGAVGMRRLMVTSSGKNATILFYVQITGLVLASLLNIQDMLRIKPEQSGVFYYITDACYPLSHLLMIVVGIFVLKAKVWRGLPAIAPFLVGLALPAVFATSAIVGFEKAFFVFPTLTAAGFLIIGFSLFRQIQRL